MKWESELHCSNWALAQPTGGDRKRQKRDERSGGGVLHCYVQQQDVVFIQTEFPSTCERFSWMTLLNSPAPLAS